MWSFLFCQDNFERFRKFGLKFGCSKHVEWFQGDFLINDRQLHQHTKSKPTPKTIGFDRPAMVERLDFCGSLARLR